MSVIINSFPRSGNKFLLGIMKKIFSSVGQNQDSSIDFHNIELLNNKKINQIVILRNPEEAIVSFAVLLLNQDGQKNTLNNAVKYWLDWHKTFLSNITSLYPFLFEQIINNPIKCLLSISSVLPMQTPEEKTMLDHYNFYYKYDQDKIGSVQASSKIHPEYLTIKKQYHSLPDPIHKQIGDTYDALILAIKNRQEKLNIVV